MRHSAYKEEYAQLLEKEFRNGGNVNSFCAEHSIAPATLYMWLRHHPELKHGYLVGKAAGKSNAEKRITENLDNPHFCHYAAANQSARMYDDKFITIPDYCEDDSWTVKAEKIVNLMATGQLEEHHAEKVMKAIQTAIECKKVDVLEQEMESLRETVLQLVAERA